MDKDETPLYKQPLGPHLQAKVPFVKFDSVDGTIGFGPLFSVGLLLTSGGLLTIRWFNIMPHLSLFSFCDETLVPVIFSGRE